jgi:hypothetical protein
MRLILASVLLVFGAAGTALAWGDEGHRIVAEIAEQYLKAGTAHQVRELLALENATTLAEVSTWADKIRGQRRETARWHYVNIPIHPPAGTPAAYDAARDCPNGDCVVAKIDELAAVLGDKAGHDSRDRLEALKFVVHFVADVHQPLHAANDGDRGGNDVRVTFMGRQTNLHAVWDTGILFAAEIGDERAYALQLARSIRPIELDQWRDGSATTWATESNDIARRLIYGEWPHGPDALRGSYAETALPVVSVQLEKAGVRLAAVLNAILR